MIYPFTATVTPYRWWSKNSCEYVDTVKIQVGDHFVILPIQEARRVIDSVHDACDEHDRTQRFN